MLEAAGRIFGDTDAAMPLVQQLIFEQCTRECHNATIGGPLSNAGLAATVVQGVVQYSKTKQRSPGACFSCGKQGHMKKQCPNKGGSEPRCPPGVCPRCCKGNHWANECRSVKDIHGQPLVQGYGCARPKNVQRGPRPQGPQIYGAMTAPAPGTTLAFLRYREGQPQDPQGWTSYAPPELY